MATTTVADLLRDGRVERVIVVAVIAALPPSSAHAYPMCGTVST
jgi:hypothetical protein